MEMTNFFNIHAKHWDENCKEPDTVRAAIASLSGATEKSKVLDIACGTGIMIPLFLDLNVHKLVGIDLAEKMVAIAKEKFCTQPNVKIICQDLMTFQETDFDIALMYNAYPHFLDKAAMIEQVASLLQPNGRFTVAHGVGRDCINKCHENVPSNISTKLLPAKEEAKQFESWFDVDIILDTPYCYMISGVVKKY
ncbi:MAG: class I SAM-dependent methyltransferase [Cellulosilyticaceae bacterium]